MSLGLIFLITVTLDKLCNILDRKVEDIMKHYLDENVF